MKQTIDLKRRTMLSISSAAGLGLLAACGTGSSMLGQSADAEGWLQAFAIDEFEVGDSKTASGEALPEKIAVIRTEEGFIALGRTCTHLQCDVGHDATDGQHYCPCHGAIFDATGAPVDGPAKEPLATYQTKVEDGVVLIKIR